MKTLKLLSAFALMATLFTSCYTEVLIEDDYVNSTTPVISVNQLFILYFL